VDIAPRTGHKACSTVILVFPGCGRGPFLSCAVLGCCRTYWSCWPCERRAVAVTLTHRHTVQERDACTRDGAQQPVAHVKQAHSTLRQHISICAACWQSARPAKQTAPDQLSSRACYEDSIGDRCKQRHRFCGCAGAGGEWLQHSAGMPRPAESERHEGTHLVSHIRHPYHVRNCQALSNMPSVCAAKCGDAMPQEGGAGSKG
jgi:hypothetical protein